MRSLGETEAGQHVGTNRAAQDLADGISWQFVERQHQAGTFVVGDVRPDPSDVIADDMPEPVRA